MVKKIIYNVIFYITALFCSIILFTQLARLVNPKIYPVKFDGLTVYPAVFIFLLAGALLAITFFVNKKFITRVKSNPKKYLIILVIFGTIFRIASVTLIKNRQVSDFKIYHELAVSLCNGTGFSYTGFTGLNEDVRLYLNKNVASDDVVPTNFRPCGYSFILSLIYRFFGIYPFLGKLFNIFVGIIAGICLFYLLFEIDTGLALWTVLFWFIYPTNIFAVNLLGTETVFLSFFIISLFLLKKSFGLKKHYKFILLSVSGFLAGYSCLIRPYLFLVMCVLFGLFVTAKRSERMFTSIMIFIIAFLLPLFAWGVRNYVKFNRFYVQSTNGGPTLVIRSRNIEPLINFKYKPYEKETRLFKDEFELNKIGMKIFKGRIITCLKENPFEFFTKFVKSNIIHAWSHDCDVLLWCGRSKFFSSKKIKIAPPVSKVILNKFFFLTNSFYLYISILALIGIIKMAKRKIVRDRYILILLSYFILNFILLCLYNGTARYHFDSMIILFIFAGYAVSSFSNEFNS